MPHLLFSFNSCLVIKPQGISILSLSPKEIETNLNNWIVQLTKQLETAHKIGYFHRDIRPKNIIISNDTAILIDWGFGLKKVQYIIYVYIYVLLFIKKKKRELPLNLKGI